MEIVKPYPVIRARDGFAGVGWGVACQRLGIEEFGFDIEPNVVATRTANGMLTPGRDLWLPETVLSDYEVGIDSPPCQTFSMAGSGSGRRALDDVLAAIDARRYLSIESLKKLGQEVGDDRTALVLTPLFYAARDLPEVIVLEQVPQVLPVWNRIAEELRSWGYSAEAAVLNSEQYGVPQTRKRAILSSEERLSVVDAGILQSFPANFVWPTTKTAAFKIIGNAVPPLLAEAVLREALDL